VAGSACSEPWSQQNNQFSGDLEDEEDDGMLFGGGPPTGGSNMVLRKRIRKIKQGMKR